jgi:hypothetical protein
MNGPQQTQNSPFPQMQPPPQRQVPTALTRFVGIVRALRGTAATAGILLIAAQLILPRPVAADTVGDRQPGGFRVPGWSVLSER